MTFSIDDFYKDFGTDVVKEVHSQVELNGNLQPLLKRLGIPSLPGVADQHQALAGFIYRYGIAFFMKVARANLSYAEVDRMKLEVLLSFRTSKPRSSSSQRTAAGFPPSPVKRRIKVPGQPTRWETVGQAVSSDQGPPSPSLADTQPLAPSAGGSAPPKPPLPGLKPISLSAPSPVVQPEQVPQANQPVAQVVSQPGIISVATYQGPDRRVQPDRRSGMPDRRQSVEIIFFKNRRFGGDRRKTVRRETDRMKLQQSDQGLFTNRFRKF